MSKVIVSIPEDNRVEIWDKSLENGVLMEKNYYGLLYEFDTNTFVNALHFVDSNVESNDYSEDGLYGTTNHVINSDGNVIGQVWYSKKEYDNYMNLNAHLV